MAKILIADDDQAIRALLIDIVSDAGHDPIEAENGCAAFEKACQEHPDIILLDLMMPVMNGIQALKKLKSNPDTKAIPVIIATAKGQERDEREAMRSGAWDYITKPWGVSEVEDRIRMALTYLKC